MHKSYQPFFLLLISTFKVILYFNLLIRSLVALFSLHRSLHLILISSWVQQLVIICFLSTKATSSASESVVKRWKKAWNARTVAQEFVVVNLIHKKSASYLRITSYAMTSWPTNTTVCYHPIDFLWHSVTKVPAISLGMITDLRINHQVKNAIIGEKFFFSLKFNQTGLRFDL